MDSFRGYGNLSAVDQARADRQRRKRIIIISISSVVLVALVVAVAVGVGVSVSIHNDSSISHSSGEISATSRAITAICQSTDYKQTCINSLSASASGYDTNDPKELIKLSFKVAIDHTIMAFSQSELLKKAAKDPRAMQALDCCKELMDHAIDDLKRSFDHMDTIHSGHDIDDLVHSIKIWLSGAMTYQETCLDGFQNTTDDVGDKMKKLMKTSTELTSNTLSIVAEISSVLDSFDLSLFKRRLLSTKAADDNDGFPTWVTAGKRKLLGRPTSDIVPDVVVAKDGSGNYTTVNDALMVVPAWGNKTFVIYVKAGVYEEIVHISRNMTHVMLLGDGPTTTKITGNKNFIDGTPTFRTATVAVIGNGFLARDIGFENSAGAEKHQAVALRVQSDLSIFYNCQMDGYQDTLYAQTHRQFYRDCTISGTIDFIFGNSAVIFQNCLIVVRKPLANQQNTITAQGRKDKEEPTALILHNCTIVADPAYYPVRNTLQTYLGRPWKQYSRTFIMQSWMDDLVQPAGWLPWMNDFALDTLFYSEFDNRGPGANTANRVQWKGIRNITADHALKFTVEDFIIGSQWINPSGVPYISGLLPLGSTATPAAARTTNGGSAATPPAAHNTTDGPTTTPAAYNATDGSTTAPAAVLNTTSESQATPDVIYNTTSESSAPPAAAYYTTTGSPASITAPAAAPSESPATPDAVYNGTTESPSPPAASYNATTGSPASIMAPAAALDTTSESPATPDAVFNTTTEPPAPHAAAYNTTTGSPATPAAVYNATTGSPAALAAVYNATTGSPTVDAASYNTIGVAALTLDAAYDATGLFTSTPVAYNTTTESPPAPAYNTTRVSTRTPDAAYSATGGFTATHSAAYNATGF